MNPFFPFLLCLTILHLKFRRSFSLQWQRPTSSLPTELNFWKTLGPSWVEAANEGNQNSHQAPPCFLEPSAIPNNDSPVSLKAGWRQALHTPERRAGGMQGSTKPQTCTRWWARMGHATGPRETARPEQRGAVTLQQGWGWRGGGRGCSLQAQMSASGRTRTHTHTYHWRALCHRPSLVRAMKPQSGRWGAVGVVGWLSGPPPALSEKRLFLSIRLARSSAQPLSSGFLPNSAVKVYCEEAQQEEAPQEEAPQEGLGFPGCPEEAGSQLGCWRWLVEKPPFPLVPHLESHVPGRYQKNAPTFLLR